MTSTGRTGAPGCFHPVPGAHLRQQRHRTRRLLAMLRAGTGRQLVVIHAPAGYGKTTLAVQWLQVLQDEGAHVAWLGLHQDDNDPHWFLDHLLEAARRALPQAEVAIAELKDLIEQSAEDMQRYTLSVLLELITRHGGRFVLTFDDWHLIDDPQVHRALVHLLDFAPPNLSLILTSRTRPRLPLSRLRVRRQLTEVDADDPAVRPRRDPRVPRRPGRPAARRRRRRPAVRGHRRLGRGAAARVALAARLRRPDPADPRLLRTAPLRRRVPRGERARRPAAGDPGVPAGHVGVRPALRRPGGQARRSRRRPGDARGARTSRPLPAAARRRARVVPLPPPLRRVPAPPSGARPPRAGAAAAPAGVELVLRARPGLRGGHARAGRGHRRTGHRPGRAARHAVGRAQPDGQPARPHGAAAARRGRRAATPAHGRGLGERPVAALGRRPGRARPPAPRDAGGRGARGDALGGRRRAGLHRRLRRPHRPRRDAGQEEPGPAPDLPAVGGRGGGQHPDVLRHLLDALPGRAGAPAVGPTVPRPHDRAVLGRLRAVLLGHRRVRPARPRRGRGAPARRGRPRPGVGRPPLARRAAGRGSAGRAALRARRAREAERSWRRAASWGRRAGSSTSWSRATPCSPGSRPTAAPRPRRPSCSRKARRWPSGSTSPGCPPPSPPNGSAGSWPRGACARPAAPRRTCPTARPAPAGSAWHRPDPHRVARRGVVRRGRPPQRRGAAGGADRRPPGPRPGPGGGDGDGRARRRRRNARRAGSPRSARSPGRWRSWCPRGCGRPSWTAAPR